MNTPSPLQPMGRLSQPGSGKPGFNIAVITIVALHVVFFGGLLLQGCRPGARDDGSELLAQMTNTTSRTVATTATNPFPDSLSGLGQPYPDTTNLSGLTSPNDHLSFTSTPPVTTVQPSTPTNLWVAPQETSLPGVTSHGFRAEVTEPPGIGGVTSLTEYKVAKGDTPSKIAQKYGVTVAQLREANPDMKDRALQIGQPLRVPAATPKATGPQGSTTPEAATPGVIVYQVKAGDTLTKIAKAHGTTVKAIRGLNSLKTDRIVANQKLKIAAGDTNATAPMPRP